jgi:hypothetical protein
MTTVKAFLAVAAVTAGFCVGWAASSRADALAVLAVCLAAANGYAKAYSP